MARACGESGIMVLSSKMVRVLGDKMGKLLNLTCSSGNLGEVRDSTPEDDFPQKLGSWIWGRD